MAASTLLGEDYPTKVGAAFDCNTDAREAVSRLQESMGIAEEQIWLEPGDRVIDRKLEPETRGIHNTLWRAPVLCPGADPPAWHLLTAQSRLPL